MKVSAVLVLTIAATGTVQVFGEQTGRVQRLRKLGTKDKKKRDAKYEHGGLTKREYQEMLELKAAEAEVEKLEATYISMVAEVEELESEAEVLVDEAEELVAVAAEEAGVVVVEETVMSVVGDAMSVAAHVSMSIEDAMSVEAMSVATDVVSLSMSLLTMYSEEVPTPPPSEHTRHHKKHDKEDTIETIQVAAEGESTSHHRHHGKARKLASYNKEGLTKRQQQKKEMEEEAEVEEVEVELASEAVELEAVAEELVAEAEGLVLVADEITNAHEVSDEVSNEVSMSMVEGTSYVSLSISLLASDYNEDVPTTPVPEHLGHHKKHDKHDKEDPAEKVELVAGEGEDKDHGKKGHHKEGKGKLVHGLKGMNKGAKGPKR